jgi:HNH endonuclease
MLDEPVLIPMAGMFVLLDQEDVDRVMERNWYPASKGGYIQSTQNGEVVALHRFVFKAQKGDLVDHRNGHPWDNRKRNLRKATTSQNARNTRPHRTSSSQFKGVSVVQRKSGPRYRTLIQIDGRQRQLGIFKSETTAARAYDAAARKHFGEFAWVNFND